MNYTLKRLCPIHLLPYSYTVYRDYSEGVKREYVMKNSLMMHKCHVYVLGKTGKETHLFSVSKERFDLCFQIKYYFTDDEEYFLKE
jgi:hypothetical protein